MNEGIRLTREIANDDCWQGRVVAETDTEITMTWSKNQEEEAIFTPNDRMILFVALKDVSPLLFEPAPPHEAVETIRQIAERDQHEEG